MLRRELSMIREACLRVLVLCTVFLKEVASYGLCLAEIGEMMSREFCSGEEEPSELEVVCIEARRLIAEREVLSPRIDLEDEPFQFDIDCEETDLDRGLKMTAEDHMSKTPFHFRIGAENGRFALPKLEESIEEEGIEDEEGEEASSAVLPTREGLPSIFNLSVSLKSTTIGNKNQKHLKSSGPKQVSGHLTNRSSGHRSATEQLPASMCFVKLADLGEEEWSLFLEKFQELLYSAFAKRKSTTLGHKQRQRLGTSCQF